MEEIMTIEEKGELLIYLVKLVVDGSTLSIAQGRLMQEWIRKLSNEVHGLQQGKISIVEN